MSYSKLERIVHSTVFASSFPNELVERIEAESTGRPWSNVQIGVPVFISSLPRSGTSALLNSISTLPELCSHNYRDMPLICAPVLWNKLSQKFRSTSKLRERAHDDGILINEDSPEAFEEILWKRFEPWQFRDSSIAILNSADQKTIDYFADHMKKIVYLRRESNALQSRHYLSKNNGNISRIKALKKAFPNARFLVPLREPLSHAFSMLRQHTNFSDKHSKDKFAKKYMSDLGHYEFGHLHKPIDFPNAKSRLTGYELTDINYWLNYWICAYRYLAEISGLDWVCQRSLAQKGKEVLEELKKLLQLQSDLAPSNSKADRPHEMRENQAEYQTVDPALAREATDIYQSLLISAIR